MAVDGTGNIFIADRNNRRIRKVDAAGVITTVAGDGTCCFGGDGGPAAVAQLRSPEGVAVDGAGNLFIADTGNNRIRKVDAAGVITTVAGDGTDDFGGDGGPAAAAQLRSPEGVAVDGAGNLYIADTFNYRIRKVDAAGVIATVAGDGPEGFVGDGGAATAARLLFPEGVAADGAGNLFIADRRNNRIRKVDAAGVVATAAGDGTRGFGGDGGPATAAQLFFPTGVAADGAGNLFIADTSNHRIRKVDAAGVITTAAGDGTYGFGGDAGPATAAQLRSPRGVAVDGAGNLFIADTSNHRIRKVDAAGVITTVAGNGTRSFGGDAGPATAARLRSPGGVAADGAGNLFIADTGNNRIRKVDAAGVITTVAGDGMRGFGGDGGPAIAARLFFPRGVAVDGAGNLFIADRDNQRIRKVTFSASPPPPVIPTVRLTASPGSITRGESATLQWSSTNAASARIEPGIGAVATSGLRRVSPTATTTYTITVTSVDERTAAASATVVVNAPQPPPAASGIATVAGDGTRGFGGDGGPAAAARLHGPYGVAMDEAGNLFIADSANHRIRKVDAAGIITTVAGDGTYGFGGDGGPAAAARLNTPWGVAVDRAGNLYIADIGNYRIRKIDAAGVITTMTGDGTYGFGGDGGPAAVARLAWPESVAVDGAGNLFIADSLNQRIRKVDAAGVITTVAGDGTKGFGGDGGSATAAQLAGPSDVAVDGAGNLFIADSLNQRIRKVDAAGVITTVAGDGTRGFGGDGGPATAARLHFPNGVAVDGAGNLFIADSSNESIRKVDAAGVITTVAGDGTHGFGGDGGPATTAQLRSPTDVIVDKAGNLYIVDWGNQRIRKVTFSPLPPPGIAPQISSGGIVLATGTPVVNRISPNAIVSVYGQEFAPQGTQAASPGLDASGKIATNLAATCLEIDGRRAPLFAVFPTQINAQVPHDLAPGQSRARVIRGCGAEAEQRSPAATVATAAVSPVFFNLQSNPDGRNPLAALHGGGPGLVGAPGSIPGLTLTPAEPGEYVTLFGTGFGATEPPLEAGRIPGGAAELASEVLFVFGGIAVPPEDVFYAGAAPCCAGLYQFTVRVPSGLPDGDALVSATVQGVSTPAGPFLAVRRR